ncbi:VWA domain-containing protein [Arhodomonas sp. SL1]|uniref:VWA domain-containing protein n=1 Tax=Arhodomonas sp. SL1 TaxID=3425691 RepID=UPI003F884055
MRLILALVLFLTAPLAAAAGQNLLFILDGSGSMWGRVDETPKISIAKEVMSELVAELPDDARAGLYAYGHRRKGDCADIESLVALGPLDRQTLVDRIQGLNPKGKTPIRDAVNQALEELRRVEETASVVLVSDGLESCGGDPCAAVKAARDAGIEFRMHVVGFGLGDTDAGQLQCMARTGGGEYYTAANAEELSHALQEAVAVKPALVLTATRNGAPTAARVFVYRAGSDDEVLRDTLGKHPDDHNPNPARLALAPGRYDVRVVPESIDADQAQHLDGITVPKEGEIERTVDFSAGVLELIVTANGEPSAARTYVYKAGSDNEVTREHTGEDGQARYNLPPGQYDINVRPEDVAAPDRRLTGVSVAAGETLRESADFSSGELRVKVTTNGEPLDARTYVHDVDSGKEADRGSTGRDGTVSYALPPGSYRVTVRPEGIAAPDEHIEDVTVEPGAGTSRSLDIPSGRLNVDVTTNGKPLDARTYLVNAATDKEADRGSTGGDGAVTYAVPVGSYRLRIRPEGIAAPDQVIEDIVVQADRTTSRSLDIPAGRLEVKVTHEGNPLDARTYLVSEDTGKETDRGSTGGDGAVTYAVPVGEYRLRIRPDGIDAADQVIEGIAVRAGETTRKAVDFGEG